MARLALRLPELVPQPIPLLRNGESSRVTLGRDQVASDNYARPFSPSPPLIHPRLFFV